MKKRRLLSLGGVLAAAALVATACAEESGGSGNGGSDDSDEPTAVTVAWNQPMYSLNVNSSYGNATANSVVTYEMTSAFNYFDDETNLVKNEDFGTYEVVNEDPTEVKYTIKDGVQWSDGTPIDAADLLLEWAAESGAVNTITADQTETDANDQIKPTKPGDVFFDGQSDAMSRTADKTPTIGDDGSFTLHYNSVFSDWETAFWAGANSGLPAHIIAREALGIEDPQEAKDAVVDAIMNNDKQALSKLANFWNTGFNFTELPKDESLYLSSGPYKITEWVDGEQVTLEKNDKYTWGPEPKVDTITIRWIEDPMAAAQALENGEIDIMSPQATSDLVERLEGIDGVQTEIFPEATYEHVDINVNNARNKGVWDDKRVREAFLKTIPRQRIVDDLIKPIMEDAELLSSQLMLSDFEGYDQMISENGSDAYAEPDIQGAEDLLKEAGVNKPEVCIMYDTANPRRVNEFSLIQASANKAGFKVTDCGSPDWGGLLTKPNEYDVALFGWQKETTAQTDSASNFVEGGINNFYGYKNPEVDKLFDDLAVAETDEEKLDIQIDIEKQLWGDAFGVTLYQFPNVTAYSEIIKNVKTAPLNPTVFWNFWEWEVE